jgi:hypothetical protein
MLRGRFLRLTHPPAAVYGVRSALSRDALVSARQPVPAPSETHHSSSSKPVPRARAECRNAYSLHSRVHPCGATAGTRGLRIFSVGGGAWDRARWVCEAANQGKYARRGERMCFGLYRVCAEYVGAACKRGYGSAVSAGTKGRVCMAWVLPTVGYRAVVWTFALALWVGLVR